MRTLIVYDSVHGNTERIARAIGDAVGDEVTVVRAGEVDPSDLERLDLLIAGAPTYGGRPTQPMQDFLSRLATQTVEGLGIAAFDTRLAAKWVSVFGYAAPRIADELEEQGGTLVGSPAGFFVRGTKGPLKEGEVERAAKWAKQIAASQE